MKSMQRLGGKMMKRSADQQDVGTVISEFKAVDEMLVQLLKDIKAWRDGWDDILKLQYNAAEAFANLYNPIEPTNSPDQSHPPAATPQHTLQRCVAMQKMYSDMQADLQQEIGMITAKIMRPVEEAKQWMKSLQKTLKHRENMKLDYERYLSRAEHGKKKEIRTVKEETALAKHEGDLAQAQINYQTADDQVRQTFPPVTEAVLSLLPYLLAHQVTIQTTMVGQIYTNLDGYCREQLLPSPGPSDGEIVSVWDSQFSNFRKELEQGLQILATGKAVHQNMAIPEKSGTVTGLSIRSKTTNLVHRNKSNQNLARPSGLGRADSAQPGASPASLTYNGEDELAPPKPPRPGTMGAPPRGVSPNPGVSMSSKPRMPSYSANSAALYDQKPIARISSYPNEKAAPPPYTESVASSTPMSQYHTPTNGLSPIPSAGGNDYFSQAEKLRRASTHSLASSAASIAAAKKKPPPPIPVKRIASQQTQFVTALYDFDGQNPSDLAFREGDRIRVVKKTDSTDDWWDGELRGKVGSFPANYVQM